MLTENGTSISSLKIPECNIVFLHPFMFVHTIFYLTSTLNKTYNCQPLCGLSAFLQCDSVTRFFPSLFSGRARFKFENINCGSAAHWQLACERSCIGTKISNFSCFWIFVQIQILISDYNVGNMCWPTCRRKPPAP
jgi:hypothetical protein